MKIYGYSNNTNEEPMKLNEVTISANPDSLREISEFLLKCAKEIENNNKWEHEHFTSLNKKEKTKLIVFNENAS